MRMTLALLLGAVLLTGCDSTEQTQPETRQGENRSSTSVTQPVRILIELKKSAPQCEDKNCPQVHITWLNYEDQPALNQAIETRLASMLVRQEGDAIHDGSIEGLADAFLADASDMAMATEQGWELNASVKQQRSKAGLLTFSMESYEYTGGAHGQPVVAYFHWDLEKQQWVLLNELLEPGQQETFWDLARLAHREWLDDQKLDDNFRESLPFDKTDDAFFNEKGLVLQYNVYHIAPYAMGQPQLLLPYDKLKGIVRDKYLP